MSSEKNWDNVCVETMHSKVHMYRVHTAHLTYIKSILYVLKQLSEIREENQQNTHARETINAKSRFGYFDSTKAKIENIQALDSFMVYSLEKSLEMMVQIGGMLCNEIVRNTDKTWERNH